MHIGDALKEAAKRLLPATPDLNQAWAEAERLMAAVLKQDRTWVLAHGEKNLSPKQKLGFKRLVARRRRHEPMAYLLGQAEFCGRMFKTDRRALIPRPETEELVSAALSTLKPQSSTSLVWDAGTGSGAIAITLKAERHSATVFASDVDGKALVLAKQNAKRILKRASAIKFFHANLLAKPIQFAILKHRAKQIVIVANLPYLPLSDKKVLAPDVVKFEPARALFTSEHGNLLIHKLLEQIARHRLLDARPISVFLEFDPPQAKALRTLAEQYFPDAKIEIRTDSCGRERILIVELGR